MEFLIDCGLFLLGLIVGNYAYTMVFFPLFYGLPKSVWWVSKRKLKFWAPLLFLALPLIFLLGLLFFIFFLDIFEKVAESFAYGLGLHLMAGFMLLRYAISSSERTKMKDAFENIVAAYRQDLPRVFE